MGKLRKLNQALKIIVSTVKLNYIITIVIIVKPDAATSATGFCCSCAIKPTTEKITKPANILVLELTEQTIKASL